jgi:hypothetical protein
MSGFYLRNRFELFLIIFAFNFNLNAEEIRYAADLTHLPAGADIAAQGDVGVVLPDRAVSSYWNPAASSYLSTYELSAEVADLYSGLSQQGCFSVHVPMQNKTGVAVTYIPFLSGDIERQDSLDGTYQQRLFDQNLRADGTNKGLFQNNQHLLLLSIGKLFTFQLPRTAGTGFPLPLDIGMGVNLKGLWQVMNPDEKIRMGMNANLDAGFISRIGVDYNILKQEISREVMIGFTIRDFLPSKVMWVNSPVGYSEQTHVSYYSGIAFADRSGDLGFNYKISLSLEKEYKVTYHAGLEAEFWDIVSFRAGISDRTPTLGAGIRYKRCFLDYAFRFDELDISYLRLSLGVFLNKF